MLVLRTCKKDMTSHNGFQWPVFGYVECKDWEPTDECGHGLHGLPWGEGNGSLLNWDKDACWLVVEVDETKDYRAGKGQLKQKCKFRCGNVVYCGDRLGATSYILTHGGEKYTVVGGTKIVGDNQDVIVGYRGNATAGYDGILQIKWYDGNRYRIAIGYVGENGIKPNVKYCCEKGEFVEIEVETV